MKNVIHTNQTGIKRDRLLRLPEVEALTGMKKSTIYELANQGRFPASTRIHSRMVGWSEAAVLAWVQERLVVGCRADPTPANKKIFTQQAKPNRLDALSITKPGWFAVGQMIEHEDDNTPDIACFDPTIFNQGPRSNREATDNAKVCAAAPQMLELLAKLAEIPTQPRYSKTQFIALASEAEDLLQALGL